MPSAVAVLMAITPLRDIETSKCLVG
jgi:hypothetical protein